MDGKKWSTVKLITEFVGGIAGLIGILAGVKSFAYEQEQQYKELEDRYGLTPIDEED